MARRPRILAALVFTGGACASETTEAPHGPTADDTESAVTSRQGADPDEHAARRTEMVARQIVRRGVKSSQVLSAMRTVPRHRFVPAGLEAQAYTDRPLPIGHGVTISQPFVVALMTELLGPIEGARVLEIGTGCGYQTAVLAAMGAEVYSIEIIEPLGKEAAERLKGLGVEAHLRIGDGYGGWPEAAPFEAIIVTAAPPRIPPPLVEQLAVGGRLVLPVGETDQMLQVVTRTANDVEIRNVDPVRFVPMTGKAQQN